MRLEALREKVGATFKGLKQGAQDKFDYHFRGVIRIHVKAGLDSIPEPCPCILCGNKNVVKTLVPYELVLDDVPTPFPKNVFDAIGAFAQKSPLLNRGR